MGSCLDAAPPRDAPATSPNAAGGTMTTRTGEPATKRESYTQYIQGRAAAVRSTPTRVDGTLPASLFRGECYVPPVCNPRSRPGDPGGPLTAPHHIEQQEMPDIDSVDRENPLAVTEYVNDIFSYWFRVEVRVRYCPLFSVIHLRGWPTSASKGQLSLRSFESICPGARSSRQSCAGSQLGVVRQPLDNLNAVIGDILRTLVAFELMRRRVCDVRG